MLNADRTDCIAVPDWAGSGATTLKLNFPQSSIIHDLSFTNGSFAPKAEVPSKSAFDPRTDVGVFACLSRIGPMQASGSSGAIETRASVGRPALPAPRRPGLVAPALGTIRRLCDSSEKRGQNPVKYSTWKIRMAERLNGARVAPPHRIRLVRFG
jgi:hypothetical protein